MAKKQKQCSKCPWRVDANPYDIPHGYCTVLHAKLKDTIADPGAMTVGPLCIMACHHSTIGREKPCVGWLANQLGPGNNIPLRLSVIQGRTNGRFELAGEQHETFEETLPK